jgi:hypothetical protein
MLAEHLRKIYSERTVIHYPQGCTYDWVTGPKDEV